MVLFGLGEVEGGELEANHIVAVVELQFVDAVEWSLRVDRLIELEEGGQDDRRNMAVVGDGLVDEGVEAVAATEKQRAVAGAEIGPAVEILSL